MFSTEKSYVGITFIDDKTCFVGHGGGSKYEIKSGVKARSKEEDFKTFRMWEINKRGSILISYYLTSRKAVDKFLEEENLREITEESCQCRKRIIKK